MKRRASRLCTRCICAAFVANCVTLGGCAAFTPSPLAKGDADRSAQPVEKFSAVEQKRDEAQFIAARDRAEHGDLDAAEALLTELLARNSNHAESRLLLADLYVAQDRTTEAERQLRAVLQKQPDHPRVHHSLGLLCDVTDRPAEAAEHFRRAAQAAPQEELYRLSLEASADSVGNSSRPAIPESSSEQ